MASRRKDLPGPIGFARLKALVRERFKGCCGYCGTPEELAGGERGMAVDAFVPKAFAAEWQGDFNNLVYACLHCNNYKANRVLPLELHPGRKQYKQLLNLEASGQLV